MGLPRQEYSSIAEHDPAPVSRLRFQTFSVFVALAMPTMLGFGGLALARGLYGIASLFALSGVGLVAGWLRLRSGRDDRGVYRVNALAFGVLTLYLLATGGDGGAMSLWVYVFPLIGPFLLGAREGAVWVGTLFLGANALLWMHVPGIDVYLYPHGFVTRFLVMYVVIAVVAIGFERSRHLHEQRGLAQHRRLETEQARLRTEIAERERAEREKAAVIEELQHALAQVKTLKGLVPICASCHRIRDDHGFWNHLETYLRAHSDATFSHGICPACLEKLYPDDAPDTNRT